MAETAAFRSAVGAQFQVSGGTLVKRSELCPQQAGLGRPISSPTFLPSHAPSQKVRPRVCHRSRDQADANRGRAEQRLNTEAGFSVDIGDPEVRRRLAAAYRIILTAAARVKEGAVTCSVDDVSRDVELLPHAPIPEPGDANGSEQADSGFDA